MNARVDPVLVSTAPKVLEAISAVMEDVAKEGISKSRNNAQQGYKFRGIDDVYNALSPILSRHKLVITPKCLSREKEVVQTAKGGTLFYVTVNMEFELASAVDGSTKTATMFGEAMDSADKATNKAMSAAYKYMAMQEFCIPTEGDNDADATTHEQVRAVPTISGACLMACDLLKASKTAEELKGLWTTNKDGLKANLSPQEYAVVVGVMKTEAERLAPAREAPKPTPKPAEDFGIGEDEIPF